MLGAHVQQAPFRVQLRDERDGVLREGPVALLADFDLTSLLAPLAQRPSEVAIGQVQEERHEGEGDEQQGRDAAALRHSDFGNPVAGLGDAQE